MPEINALKEIRCLLSSNDNDCNKQQFRNWGKRLPQNIFPSFQSKQEYIVKELQGTAQRITFLSTLQSVYI